MLKFVNAIAQFRKWYYLCAMKLITKFILKSKLIRTILVFIILGNPSETDFEIRADLDLIDRICKHGDTYFNL